MLRAMKSCFAILFVFLPSARTLSNRLKNSFVIVDSTKIYHLTATNENKIFDRNHNSTEPINFLEARAYIDGFDAVYGGCRSKFVGYYRQEGENIFFGSLPLEITNVTNVCGVTPGMTQNTFYASLLIGVIANFDGKSNQLKIINSVITDTCRFNLLLYSKGALYFLEGSCDPYKSNKLGFQDVEPNSAVTYLEIPEQVKKMKIDFSTNEVFAITESEDLKKGKIESDNKVTLEAVKNVNQKILDITLTPSDIYYIEKDSSIVKKMKRSDTEAPVQVFNNVTFDKLQGISYLHFGEEKDHVPDAKGKDFSASMNLHLAFYFAMFLVNLELWNL